MQKNFKALHVILGNQDQEIITFYTDDCSYQNHNCVIVNSLMNLAMNYNVIIEQNLEFVRTQIEVD